MYGFWAGTLSSFTKRQLSYCKWSSSQISLSPKPPFLDLKLKHCNFHRYIKFSTTGFWPVVFLKATMQFLTYIFAYDVRHDVQQFIIYGPG